ncbi:MAG TPA: acetate kinase, partial [Azonexus sp.]|nr:acetate kinase [Azonexus sp.]
MKVNLHSHMPSRATGVAAALAIAFSGFAQGAEISAAEAKALKAKVNEQAKRMEALKKQLADTDAKLQNIQQALGVDVPAKTAAAATPAKGKEAQPAQVAQAAPAAPVPQATAAAQQPATVGESRPERVQQVAQIFEQPGVLTPAGQFSFETGIQYSYSSSNRVSLVGYTIIPAITIGLIDVREVRRNSTVANFTGRWGVTNRMELEAKVPLVYRSDDQLTRPLNLGAGRDELFNSTGQGIGDVEATARYQFNDTSVDKPVYIGSLRFKSRTGKDPFEVLTDTTQAPELITNRIETELPTGSGFYTIQPGLTVLYPTDPAVFFGGLNYQFNLSRSGVTANTTQGQIAVGDVDPGDVFGFNFGMGLALNEKSSFSLGYDGASVGKTKINGVDAINASRIQLGTLLLGYSQRLTPSTSLG